MKISKYPKQIYLSCEEYGLTTEFSEDKINEKFNKNETAVYEFKKIIKK
jgi:hypothetical protein